MSLRVFHNGCDWVVALDAEDAWNVWCEASGESRDDYKDDMEWGAEPDDKPLTIWHDRPTGPCGCKAEIDAFEQDRERKLAQLDKLPAVARERLIGGLPKPPKTRPNGHLLDCKVGATTKTCGQWAQSDGRGFLCSTEW
jgi:hypothetical protein